MRSVVFLRLERNSFRSKLYYPMWTYTKVGMYIKYISRLYLPNTCISIFIYQKLSLVSQFALSRVSIHLIGANSLVLHLLMPLQVTAKMFCNFGSSLPTLCPVLVQPSFVRRDGQGEVDVAFHVPVVLVLVHKLGDELRRESDQESLNKDNDIFMLSRVLWKCRNYCHSIFARNKQNKRYVKDVYLQLTFEMTAKWAIMSKILNQMPMFSALSATALLVSQTNFWASSRISTQLLSRAKKGARGNAATKIVMKPNCRTKSCYNRLAQWSSNQSWFCISFLAGSFPIAHANDISHTSSPFFWRFSIKCYCNLT